MRKFLRDHNNSLLVVLTILFIGFIIGYFVWGIGYVFMEANKANASQTGSDQVPGFDLKGAAGLDYRGVVPQGVVSSS